MEEQNNKKDHIDLRLVWRRIWENRVKFYIVLPITFVISCAYVLCLPRYYASEVKLVPEIGGTGMGGTLGDLASSFGIDLSDTQSSDAISPLLYPDLMEDNGFVANLFNIRVKSAETSDVAVDTTYYAYMRWFQKQTPWAPFFNSIRKIFEEKDKTKDNGKNNTTTEFDPYNVSKKDFSLMETIRKNINISVDKKTAVITISVQAQDPLICKSMVDSIKGILQDFITDYRTNKARVDVEYYQKLTKEAQEKYEQSIKAYSELVDADQDVVLQAVKSKQDELENEMQSCYNAYNTLQVQLQAAQAKVQERTPAFTLLKGASVPIRPAGPKRMIIVSLICFLTFSTLLLFILRKDIKKQLD